MKPRLPDLDRRTLLIGGGVGIGLIVAVTAWPRRPDSALPARGGEQLFGHYLKIGADGRVTVAVPQVETGQGIWTTLPQLVADELGAAWETVAVEPAPLSGPYANAVARDEGWFDGLGFLRELQLDEQALRITARSTSMRAFHEPMRAAGAAARAMLIEAAAERWNVAAEECDTADGLVVHSRQAVPFGEIAEAAAAMSPPSRPPLRTGGPRLVGKPLPRLDLSAKSDGSFRFAADVRLPGMLFASARMAPPQGRITGFSEEAARAAGARAVVAGDGWVAALSNTSWAAERAIRAANVRYAGLDSTGDLRSRFERALAEGSLATSFTRGDYEAAVEGSRAIAATYWSAPALHLGLEPPTATVRLSGDRVEIWAPTQAPGLARAIAAKAAGGDVTSYPMPVGDPGGRALEADLIPVAITLARRSGRAVQVSLPPQASQSQDRVAPAMLARISALPGAGGITTAWRMRLATSSGLGAAIARLAGGNAAAIAADAAVPPYAIPHVRVVRTDVEAPYAAGYMRGDPERALTFFTESFIDELARIAGIDPLAFRMRMLGSNRRLAHCLQAAAAMGGWDGGGSGSSLGIAACSAYGSHIALLANATIGADQRIEVHRLFAAVDCGRVINPQVVQQQIQGGLIWALGQATAAEPEWVAGMPRARALNAIGLPKLASSPQIAVQLVPSSAPPGGVSGLAVPVLAPAVANAIFAGTGKRLRSLPFDPM